MNTLTFL